MNNSRLILIFAVALCVSGAVLGTRIAPQDSVKPHLQQDAVQSDARSSLKAATNLPSGAGPSRPNQDGTQGNTPRFRSLGRIESTHGGLIQPIRTGPKPEELYGKHPLERKGRHLPGSKAGVQAVLSQEGLQYAKNVVVGEVLQELIPLSIPDMQIDLMTPLGFPVHVNMTSIVLRDAVVPDTKLLLDAVDESITVFAGDVRANMTLGWSYVYGYLHDQGNASVYVDGLHVVLVANVSESTGSLLVGAEEVGCAIDFIRIDLHSPYSWIYNWLESMLPNHLRAAVAAQVEDSIGIILDELNDFLQALPRLVPLDRDAQLNVSVPENPFISTDYLLLQSDGEFLKSSSPCGRRRQGGGSQEGFWKSSGRFGHLQMRGSEGVGPEEGPNALLESSLQENPEESRLRPSMEGERGGGERGGGALRSASTPWGLIRREADEKMVTLQVSQGVVDSALQVYYDTGAFSFAVQKLPSSFPFQLNTHAWRFLLPSLFRQYPNRDMELAFQATTIPNVTLTRGEGVDASVDAVFYLRVLLEDGPKDVMCIDIGLVFSSIVGLSGNNVTASCRLAELTVDLRWSTVGTISPAMLEGISRTLAKLVVVPLVNYRLREGFPLVSIPGVQLINAVVVYHDLFFEVCADLNYTGGIFGPTQASHWERLHSI